MNAKFSSLPGSEKAEDLLNSPESAASSCGGPNSRGLGTENEPSSRLSVRGRVRRVLGIVSDKGRIRNVCHRENLLSRPRSRAA